jgi:hypothetical protein
MTARRKKLIAVALIPAWLIFYAGGATLIADRLPDHWLARLVYFIVAGLAWTIPVLPLLRWVEGDRR